MLEIRYSIFDKKGETKINPASININDPKEYQKIIDFMREALITISTDALLEEQRKGFPQNPDTFVDGVRTKDLRKVKPFGEIVHQRKFTVDSLTIVVDVLKELIKRSVTSTGLYAENHLVFFKGSYIGNTPEMVSSFVKNPSFKVESGAVFRIVNILPYAGMLERQGISKGRQNMRIALSKRKQDRRKGLRVRQPNGAYILVERKFKKKYPNGMKLEFRWVNGKNIKAQRPSKSKTGANLRYTFAEGSGRKGFYVHPSIVIILDKESFGDGL